MVFLFPFFPAQIPENADGDWINGIYTGCHLSKTINKIMEKVCGQKNWLVFNLKIARLMSRFNFTQSIFYGPGQFVFSLQTT